MGKEENINIEKYLCGETKEKSKEKDLEGVFLILKDFESGNNIYMEGTTTNLIPKNAPKTNYIRYYSSGEMLKTMGNDLALLSQYRNDINLSSFVKYLGTKDIEKIKMQQYYNSRTVAFINKIITETRIVSIAIIKRGGKYYGMRRDDKYKKENEKIPKLMLTYMIKRLILEENVEIPIDYLVAGYKTTKENLPFVKKLETSVPGVNIKGSYEKGIYNHYMLTGKSLIPMETYE